MPQIAKQSPKPTPRNRSGSVWDNVVDVGEHDSGGIHVSLYGRGKTGKTRLIATFPKPVLIIGAEDGTKSLGAIKGVHFVRLKESRHIADLAEEATEKGFKTVAIDTASALQDLVMKEILGLSELPAQKSWGMASRDQWGQGALQVKTLLRKVTDLPLNVVITAHERNFNEDSESELLLPSVGSALSPSIAHWLNGAVDYVCQTFIRGEFEEKVVKIAGKETKVKRPSGRVEYCLRIGPHPVYMTGFRLPPGYDLPESIVDPSYEKIMKIIRGE